jgi:hypothetical protein
MSEEVTLTLAEKSAIREEVRSQYREAVKKEVDFWNYVSARPRPLVDHIDKDWHDSWPNSIRSKAVYEDICRETYLAYARKKVEGLAAKRHAPERLDDANRVRPWLQCLQWLQWPWHDEEGTALTAPEHSTG